MYRIRRRPRLFRNRLSRLVLEPLESRVAPATITFEGPHWIPYGPGPFYGGQTSGININAGPATANPVSGTVTVVAVQPNNPAIIYAGTANGGVWKTVNGD